MAVQTASQNQTLKLMKLTKETAQQIAKDWYAINEAVKNNNLEEFNFEEVYEDGEYTDRYFWGSVDEDVEFCITTDSQENETYLSQDLYISLDDCIELYDLSKIETIAERGE